MNLFTWNHNHNILGYAYIKTGVGYNDCIMVSLMSLQMCSSVYFDIFFLFTITNCNIIYRIRWKLSWHSSQGITITLLLRILRKINAKEKKSTKSTAKTLSAICEYSGQVFFNHLGVPRILKKKTKTKNLN